MVMGLGWPTIDQAKLTEDSGLRQAYEHAFFQKVHVSKSNYNLEVNGMRDLKMDSHFSLLSSKKRGCTLIVSQAL